MNKLTPIVISLLLFTGSAIAQNTPKTSTTKTVPPTSVVKSTNVVADGSDFLDQKGLDSVFNSLRKNFQQQKQKEEKSLVSSLKSSFGAALETFMPFQFKYAILLNESVEKLTNATLYEGIDSWYGTRYRYGGTSKKGIDCSSFMQQLSSYAFGWMLPRTAREQYKVMDKIEVNDLREGDFVFFNTTGGVSHVGMYLANGKFIHAASSKGVSIGNLTDGYWSKRLIGARRVTDESLKQNSIGGGQID